MPSLVLLCLVGCNFGGSTPPMEPPAPPEYERAFDQFADVPHQITAHVEWAAEPIDGAIALADEIAALRTKLSADGDAFTSMFTAAFKGGTIEISVEFESSRAEIEATLAKVKAVGNDLKGIPSRVKAATKGISKLVLSTPKLMTKASKELTADLSVSAGDGKVKLQADLDTVKALPDEVKAEAAAAKDVVKALPSKAQTATTNLMAAIAGKPYEPMETTGAGASVEVEGDAGAAIDASAEVGATAIASKTTDPFGDASTTTDPFGGTSPTKAAAKVAVVAKAATKATGTRSSKDPISIRIAMLQREAKAMSKYGDWLSATQTYEEALTFAPEDPSLRFSAGHAAMKAKDCTRARSHFDRYLQSPEASEDPQRPSAEKALGEMRTFDCPTRTAEDEAAVAQTLQRRATGFREERDFGGAALMFALAYQRAPDDPLLAYETGVSSWKAHECGDAVSYFYHFLTVADSRAHRRQVGQSRRYIEQSETGECQPLPRDEREQQARALYTQAQELAQVLDHDGAVGKYERAYALMPDNHAFDLRIAETHWAAGHCEQAVEHYRGFLSKAAGPRYETDIAESQAMLSEIEASGCGASGGGTASGTGSASGATTPGAGGGPDEGPPPVAASGAGSARCSVGAGGSGGALPLGLLLLVLGARRRRNSD